MLIDCDYVDVMMYNITGEVVVVDAVCALSLVVIMLFVLLLLWLLLMLWLLSCGWLFGVLCRLCHGRDVHALCV